MPLVCAIVFIGLWNAFPKAGKAGMVRKGRLWSPFRRKRKRSIRLSFQYQTSGTRSLGDTAAEVIHSLKFKFYLFSFLSE